MASDWICMTHYFNMSLYYRQRKPKNWFYVSACYIISACTNKTCPKVLPFLLYEVNQLVSSTFLRPSLPLVLLPHFSWLKRYRLSLTALQVIIPYCSSHQRQVMHTLTESVLTLWDINSQLLNESSECFTYYFSCFFYILM